MSNQNKSAEKKSPPQDEKDHSEITDSESRAEKEVVVVMEEGAKQESLSEDKAAPKKELSRGVKWIFALIIVALVVAAFIIRTSKPVALLRQCHIFTATVIFVLFRFIAF